MRRHHDAPAVGCGGNRIAFLAATVIGSGIMAQQLAAGNTAVALLANTGATVAALAMFDRFARADERGAFQPSRVVGTGITS